MQINMSGSVMFEPLQLLRSRSTYRNAFGLPMMRMTFDYKENEHKIGRHAAQVINDIAKSMNPTRLNRPWRAPALTVVPYQSTHNTGARSWGPTRDQRLRSD